jgi:inner membrane protease ATP23
MAEKHEASSASSSRGKTYPEGAFALEGDEAERSKCRQLVDKALSTCPKIRFMREALQKLGVAADAEFVQCAHCPEGAAAAGGYFPDKKQVVLCQQWVAQAPGEVENTIVHEMVHAYDDARAYLNWQDLVQHACTEIRAARLSGDCTVRRELDRGNINLLYVAGQGARCIRRRAELSVSMHPGCPSAAAAADAVSRAWETCYHDTAPFDEHATFKY